MEAEWPHLWGLSMVLWLLFFLFSILTFRDLNKIKTPNFFHGTVMAAFTGVEHCLCVVSLFVSKIMAKKAFVAAHRA